VARGKHHKTSARLSIRAAILLYLAPVARPPPDHVPPAIATLAVDVLLCLRREVVRQQLIALLAVEIDMPFLASRTISKSYFLRGIASGASASAYAVTAITAAFSFNCCTFTLSRVSAAE
jgi:hypothetical protein